MYLDTLYHWSPKRNRQKILRDGLQLMQKATCQGFSTAYLCFGLTPSAAWGLSAGFYEFDEDESFDLWQVSPSKDDHLHVSYVDGKRIMEVRALNSIPADRVWWAGERTIYAHETVED